MAKRTWRAAAWLAGVVSVCALTACARDAGGSHPVLTPMAPAAIGPYSQAIEAAGALYVSGQLGLDPHTGQLAAADIRGQTQQVMRNLSAVLAAGGADWNDVVQSQVYLADLSDFQAMNEIYASYLKAPYPARATIQVSGLPREARVEIALIAVKARKRGNSQ